MRIAEWKHMVEAEKKTKGNMGKPMQSEIAVKTKK